MFTWDDYGETNITAARKMIIDGDVVKVAHASGEEWGTRRGQPVDIAFCAQSEDNGGVIDSTCGIQILHLFLVVCSVRRSGHLV